MKFTAMFRSLGTATATFDFTNDADVAVDIAKAEAANWVKDSASNT